MDFVHIKTKEVKEGTQIFPSFQTVGFKDLMVRGGKFYAFWDAENKVWSRDINLLTTRIDELVWRKHDELQEVQPGVYIPQLLKSFEHGKFKEFENYCRALDNRFVPLDSKLTFLGQERTREDYCSKSLPYALVDGPTDAWDELLDVLYDPEERQKIEWAIGAIVEGDSIKIQKFFVFYGRPRSGKSTVLNFIEMLFRNYVSFFDAKSLGNPNKTFATEAFKSNPLVAIQHDGDLSKIADNTLLNSIVAHEPIMINEKYVSAYAMAPDTFMFMGTNQPVEISDAKSGLLRRLIDINPSGRTVDYNSYMHLKHHIEKSLGEIAFKCREVYLGMGISYYDNYRPKPMQEKTDVFYNYVESHFDIFKAPEGVTLKQAWDLYKEWCDDVGIAHRLPQMKFREELKEYFEFFDKSRYLDGERKRNWYGGFKHLESQSVVMESQSDVITLRPYDPIYDKTIFDLAYEDQPAQLAKMLGDKWQPGMKWEKVTTTLKDIPPDELHYVKVPENHIVIDFDLVDEDGEKSLEVNLKAAREWPATYAETSQSGKGLHLHYIYVGDVHELASVYAPGIEVKTLLGDASLRRKVKLINDHEIAQISSGLPLKEKKMLDTNVMKSEKSLRELIERNLRKEIHPGTKPSVDFIHKILEEAYDSGMSYDVTDMRNVIFAFAAKSSNQSKTCIKTVQTMKFASDDQMPEAEADESPLVFYDVEVYPNLFVVCWKPEGKAMEQDAVVKMINPTPQEVEELLRFKLVGFNNRKYDNHILYARYLGFSNEDLYLLSQDIIVNKKRDAFFGAAWDLSFADIYDFSSKKQGLKQFQIELGIRHMEMDIPWDQPVPEHMIMTVAEYCANDVLSTEEVFNSRKQDYIARQILSELSGLSINKTTQKHTAQILFGDDKEAFRKFNYTDLSERFPGYTFDPFKQESIYRDEITGEGGYVYAEPGAYSNVALLDVASMHPTSIEELNLFGPYTENFSDLKRARMAIKHREYDAARELLDGKLRKFLDGAEGDPDSAEALSYALKIVINIVYGLTSAKFDNPFRDPRNVDNIVAKRGALFMIDLKHALQERGVTVAHIKTDSVKIPGATPEDINFVIEFGKAYGYDFEHEATYDKLCLVNEAVYIARSDGKWTAVGAQFQMPYVYKTLFSNEPIEFDDLCVAKNVREGTMYLDTSGTGDINQMAFIGSTQEFVPVRDGGGSLYRVKEDKGYAVTGTKGFSWVTRHMAEAREENYELFVDMDYFEAFRKDAVETIKQFMPFEEFIS
jgi:hypothetical protein